MGKSLLLPFFCSRFQETDDKKNLQKPSNAEHLSIRAFALAPGQIPTRLATETGAIGDGGVGAPDSIALPAATMLYLTSGRADWLSGRFVYFTWLLPPLFLAFFFLTCRERQVLLFKLGYGGGGTGLEGPDCSKGRALE